MTIYEFVKLTPIQQWDALYQWALAQPEGRVLGITGEAKLCPLHTYCTQIDPTYEYGIANTYITIYPSHHVILDMSPFLTILVRNIDWLYPSFKKGPVTVKQFLTILDMQKPLEEGEGVPE